MIYYILLKDDNETDCIKDTNLLGEVSFGSFYPGNGFNALKKLVHEFPEKLSEVRIITGTGKQISIESFLETISILRIRE